MLGTKVTFDPKSGIGKIITEKGTAYLKKASSQILTKKNGFTESCDKFIISNANKKDLALVEIFRVKYGKKFIYQGSGFLSTISSSAKEELEKLISPSFKQIKEIVDKIAKLSSPNKNFIRKFLHI